MSNDFLSRIFTDKECAMRILLVSALILVALTFIAYIPAVSSGFIWDDDAHVFANPHLFEEAGLWRIWFTGESQQYYPLVYSSFWLEWRLWGANPLGYHLVNVAIHSVNAILVALVLLRLRVPGAWAAALIFALHPVNVESVAWVSERKNVLSGFFYLASFLSFLNFEDGKGRVKWYFFAFLLFLSALLSKTVTCSLPAAVMIAAWMRSRLDWKYALRLIPFFATGLVMGLVTVWWEVNQVGAKGGEWAITSFERMLLPARSLWFYAGKLFLPYKLTFIYPRFELDPAELWQWLFPVALIAVFISLWFLRGRITRGPVAAVAFFSVTLFPAIGFFDVYPFRYSFVADHFQYLASIGLIALACGVAAAFLKESRVLAVGIVAVVCIIFGILTWQQGHIYKDEDTLWRAVLQNNPSAWIAHNNLGEAANSDGRVTEALEYYEKAVEIWPYAYELHHNLGSSYLKTGDFKKGETHLRKALSLRPGLAETKAELSLLLSETGRFKEAFSEGSTAIYMSPESAEIHNSFGMTLVNMGRFEEAKGEFTEAVRLRATFVEAINNTGVALSGLGRDREALTYFKRAIEINPRYAEAYYNAGVTLGMTGKPNEAMDHYMETLRLDPAHFKAQSSIGNLHFMNGNFTGAAESYRKALEINPGFTDAKRNLLIVLKKLEE